MFSDPYYYYRTDDGIYYYTITMEDDKPEIKLYFNEKLVDKKGGFFGEFNLSHEDLEVKIVSQLTKATREHTYKGELVEFTKVKKKQLRTMLTEASIYNGVNPAPPEGGSGQVDFKMIAIAGLAFAVAAFLYWQFSHYPKPWVRLVVMGGLVLGPYLFFSSIQEKFTFLKYPKIILLFSLVLGVGSGFLLDQFNYGDVGALHSELGTEKSGKTQAEITEVYFQDEIRRKGSIIGEPHFKHIYSYTVDGKSYTGFASRQVPVYKVGDKIDIYYHKSDPRVTKLVE